MLIRAYSLRLEEWRLCVFEQLCVPSKRRSLSLRSLRFWNARSFAIKLVSRYFAHWRNWRFSKCVVHGCDLRCDFLLHCCRTLRLMGILGGCFVIFLVVIISIVNILRMEGRCSIFLFCHFSSLIENSIYSSISNCLLYLWPMGICLILVWRLDRSRGFSFQRGRGGRWLRGLGMVNWSVKGFGLLSILISNSYFIEPLP